MPEASGTLRARIAVQWHEVVACLVGLVVGIAGPFVCWHYLTLARAGAIPPSPVNSTAGAPPDNPVRTYVLGIVLCIVIGLVALWALYVILRPMPNKRASGGGA